MMDTLISNKPNTYCVDSIPTTSTQYLLRRLNIYYGIPNIYYVDSHNNLQNNLGFSPINILCKDVVNIIIDYSSEYILLNWIDINKLDFRYLSMNPNAIDLLEKHSGKIDWDLLSRNPNAIHLLEKHPEKINWN